MHTHARRRCARDSNPLLGRPRVLLRLRLFILILILISIVIFICITPLGPRRVGTTEWVAHALGRPRVLLRLLPLRLSRRR